MLKLKALTIFHAKNKNHDMFQSIASGQKPQMCTLFLTMEKLHPKQGNFIHYINVSFCTNYKPSISSLSQIQLPYSETEMNPQNPL